MCDGCWFGTKGCVGANEAYALAPFNGQPTGSHSPSYLFTDKEDARISVAWCLEQMKNHDECSKQFIGVANSNGHCWCAKKGGDCYNDQTIGSLTSRGHFFELSLPSCDIQNSFQEQGTNCTCLPGFKGSITWVGDTASGDCSPGELKTRPFAHALAHS